jgi:regulator of protease activity HflC (stomatin/prohibitin superfamily)
VRVEGLRWTNPFYTKQRISLRVRNFESNKLKVNDSDGNPDRDRCGGGVAGVDTAEAVFCVDDYENYVHIQSESALRQMAQSYPYDAHDDSKPSLRSHGEVINNHLRDEIQTRLGKAGVQVVESRISHLAYAQEIAQAMLQRQQAGAIIAARTQIVEGAVSMVEMALDQLSKRGVVQLDEERKASMVSNLLVVLCGERGTQPVVPLKSTMPAPQRVLPCPTGRPPSRSSSRPACCSPPVITMNRSRGSFRISPDICQILPSS